MYVDQNWWSSWHGQLLLTLGGRQHPSDSYCEGSNNKILYRIHTAWFIYSCWCKINPSKNLHSTFSIFNLLVFVATDFLFLCSLSFASSIYQHFQCLWIPNQLLSCMSKIAEQGTTSLRNARSSLHGKNLKRHGSSKPISIERGDEVFLSSYGNTREAWLDGWLSTTARERMNGASRMQQTGLYPSSRCTSRVKRGAEMNTKNIPQYCE